MISNAQRPAGVHDVLGKNPINVRRRHFSDHPYGLTLVILTENTYLDTDAKAGRSRCYALLFLRFFIGFIFLDL